MITSNIIQNKTRNTVYDISLDGTVVNALGMNVISNTDGFNFRMPDTFRYTEEHPYISNGKGRNSVKGQKYVGVYADVAEFEDTYLCEPYITGIQKMGLGIDEFCNACVQFARKNYADLMPDESIKLVGNTIKSKKMPIYIEKFLNQGIELLLHGKGREFLELYYDYIEKIYNMKIPLKDIASVGKIKTTLKEYMEGCKQLTAGGTKKARQAWYELAIKEKLSVHMGDAIYYINNGTKKGDSDVKRVTRYFYINSNNKRIYYAKDENGNKLYDRKGELITLTKQLEKEFVKYKKENKDYKTKCPNLPAYVAAKYPSIEEEDVVLFNCVLLNNELVEDEDDHFCDDTFEYNREKYIEMFNKRIRPLLVVFDKNIRETINEKGKIIDNILISDPKDRKVFTEEEARLVGGQPYNDTDQDTYEQLMTMEDKEIKFWIENNKTPLYADCIDGMNWNDIKEDYYHRQEQMKQQGIKDEIEQYNKIINGLKQSDVAELIENGIMPEKLIPLIDENFQTGVFRSKKWGIQLGTIYDIIDKDFTKKEEITEE